MHLYCITMHFFFLNCSAVGGVKKKKKKNFSKLLSESVIYMEMNGNWCLSLKTAKKIYTSLCCSVWSEALKNLEYNFNEKEGGGDKVETENEKRSDHTWGNFIPYKSHTPFTLYNKKETKWVYIHKMHGNILL